MKYDVIDDINKAIIRLQTIDNAMSDAAERAEVAALLQTAINRINGA